MIHRTITNEVIVNGETDSVTLAEGDASIIARKQSDTSVYSPGQTITYTIDILNDSGNNAENVTISDPISSFKVMTAGGTEATALKEWTVDSTVASDGDHTEPSSFTNISEYQ